MRKRGESSATAAGMITTVAGGRWPSPRRGLPVAALLTIALFCCVLGFAAPSSAAPQRSSAQASLALLAVQQAELTAADGAFYDFFGSSVALSGDTALVGASGHTVGTNGLQGAAYVFVRSGSSWSQQGPELVAGDGAYNDEFGYSVAVSGDTALVGAIEHDVGAKAGQGAAYAFVRSGTVWTQQAELTAGDGIAHDWFGHSVALFGDTAVVGANLARWERGAAYVFVRSGSSWSQQGPALVHGDDAASDAFGYSVALSGDSALVGAPWHHVGTNPGQGAAYVFTLPAPALTLTISAPTGTSSYVAGSTLTVNWTSSPALASGEFGVWARSAAGSWYIGKLVAAGGGTSFTTSVTLDVPAASGYQAIVAWRPTAGSGSWLAFGTQTGSFAVSTNPAKAITAFGFLGLTPTVTGTITEANHTIALTVPYGTNVSALVPTITTTGASVSPASGVAHDFTSPRTYTVTAADGTTQAYAVTVTVAAAVIGQSYGGGKIAYILQSGDPGWGSGETRGLIAATADQSRAIRWYNGTFIATGATGIELGTGSANTTTIIAVQGETAADYAAGLARAYNGGGYSDWYLPSKDELNRLYVNRLAIGGFDLAGSAAYWTSSEYDATYAWEQNFGDGYQGMSGKLGWGDTRAVRAFPGNWAKAPVPQLFPPIVHETQYAFRSPRWIR